RVVAIHRGERRALQSLVIELDESELSGSGESVAFQSFTGKPADALAPHQVRDLLVESGLWTALRRRPFSKVPPIEESPRAIFVTAMDSHPLAPRASVVLSGREKDFAAGLKVLAQLTEGPVYVCKAAGEALPLEANGRCRIEEFDGPHPAGTPGVHIHWLEPVGREKVVWHVGYQDVAAVGYLFATGELDIARTISVAGPSVKNPRLLKTRLGAAIDDLLANEIPGGEHRRISGSVLSGRVASGEVFGYLGRYHNQISVVPEGRGREFLGWLAPGFGLYSTVNAFASRLLPGKKFRFNTSTNGSDRAMVPIGMYERVMPIDILPTFLLRALLIGDIEQAERLGCLELDEEDLSLCTFVCPGKADYGPLLRQVLTMIEKEG
ncbi:MAG TPA: Na(+)-translocating NADH-quinone reductase subunit A, partial [Sinorhizobium sp.]|nr:Na(+)-translocating NADH-quinone reductase subunit A [Sinorhizobium sp.]